MYQNLFINLFEERSWLLFEVPVQSLQAIDLRGSWPPWGRPGKQESEKLSKRFSTNLYSVLWDKFLVRRPVGLLMIDNTHPQTPGVFCR